MNPSKKPLPRSRAEWNIARGYNGLQNTTIHKYGQPRSASKIGFEQYLLLGIVRVKSGSVADFMQAQERWVAQKTLGLANSRLGLVTSWKRYISCLKHVDKEESPTLKSIPQMTPEEYLGTFTLVYQYHHFVEGTTLDHVISEDDKILFSLPPKSERQRTEAFPARQQHHSRSKATQAGSIGSNDQISLAHRAKPDRLSINPSRIPKYANPVTANRPIRKSLPITAPFATSGEDDDQNIELSSLVSPGAKSRRLPHAISLDEKAEDEDIVNASLLRFLNAITVHFADITNSWTFHRRAFKVRDSSDNDRDIYEARVDGYLRFKKLQNVYAIVEVKAAQRDRDEKAVQRQEGAQIAAWICQQPPTKNEEGKYTRLLISQNRNQIYLSFATFDDAYVDYISGRSAEVKSCLEIRDFGPFLREGSGHMEKLGYFLLAYCWERLDDFKANRR